MGYSRSIQGVFTGYSYVSVMCRLCIGYVSEHTRSFFLGGASTTWMKEIEAPARCAHEILINLITARPVAYCVLRNKLQPRQNGLATRNSLCSLWLPSFFLSPKINRFSGTPIGFMRNSCA